ncbi:MAG: hypothetical protein AAF682_23995 [Planctomycetota bacterium]
MELVAPLLAGLLALAGTPGPAQDSDPSWGEIWHRLAEVRALEAESPGRAAALAELEAVAEARSGSWRGDLLAVHVDRLLGRTAALRMPTGSTAPWPFSLEESWLAAEVLEASPARSQAALSALAGSPAQLSGQRVRLAWEIGVEEARALRLEGAQAIQAALHERYLAVWSAMDLALTESRLGAYEAADRVLAAQIAREGEAGRPTVDLWSQRGTLALGSGDEERARDYLGFARARGSSNAGVVLARLDLDRGKLPEARAGFRALLLDPEPSPWAPRGWGLALLPRGSGGTSQVGD